MCSVRPLTPCAPPPFPRPSPRTTTANPISRQTSHSPRPPCWAVKSPFRSRPKSCARCGSFRSGECRSPFCLFSCQVRRPRIRTGVWREYSRTFRPRKLQADTAPPPYSFVLITGVSALVAFLMGTVFRLSRSQRYVPGSFPSVARVSAGDLTRWG